MKNKKQNENMMAHPDLQASKSQKAKRKVAGGGSKTTTSSTLFPRCETKHGVGYVVGKHTGHGISGDDKVLVCISKDEWNQHHKENQQIVGPCKHMSMAIGDIKIDEAQNA